MAKSIRKSDVDMGELYHGYCSCRKRKRNTLQEQEFSFHITTALPKLRNELLTETYAPLPARTFLITKPVLREIFAPDFKDRVDQHFVSEKLEPLFEKEFIYDCYSCRKGKGTLFGIKRLQRFIAQCSANFTKDCYILLGDIKGYFMSIVRGNLWEKLKAFVEEKYHNNDKEKLLWQLHVFLFNSPLNNVVIRGNRKLWRELPDNKSVFSCCGAPKPCDYDGEYTADMDVNKKGLTIGALPSQMLGNFYLSPFDHFCKSMLRFYGRYVDDFYIVHESKEFLLNIVKVLKEFLKSMGLVLHPDKIRVLHYKQGIPFLGAIIKGKALLPGKRIRGGFRRVLRDIDELPDYMKHTHKIEDYVSKINSYLGMLKHFNARKYIRNMIERHPRVKFFFHIEEDLSKVTSIRKIMEKQHQYAWKITMRRYHEQFRKRNEYKPFLSRKRLYDFVYFELYGIMPSLEHQKLKEEVPFLITNRAFFVRRNKKRKANGISILFQAGIDGFHCTAPPG